MYMHSLHSLRFQSIVHIMQQHLVLPIIIVVVSVVMLTGQTDGAIESEYATES